MTDHRYPKATPDRIQTADVGNVFTVKAADSDDDDAFTNHAIELKDPPGRVGHVFNCRRCGAWYMSAVNFETDPCLPDPHHSPEHPFLIDDTEKERTRTLVMNIPMPDLLHALFCSDAYQWHTHYNADVDVMLATTAGLKSVKLYPHDGDLSPPTFDDFFSNGTEDEPNPHDKAAATFVIYDDAELVAETADELLSIARDAPVYKRSRQSTTGHLTRG